MSDPRLRRTLVTEAGHYVGPELTSQLAKLGHKLVLHAPAPGVAASLVETGVEVEVVGAEEVSVSGPISLASARGWELLIERARSRFGGLDSAYISSMHYTEGPLGSTSTADYERVRGNIDVAFHALRALTVSLDRGRQAAILMQSSAHATNPQPGWTTYAPVRAAQLAMARAAALEFAPHGVSINTVATAFVDFPGYRGGTLSTKDKEAIAKGIPTRHFGDMSALAAFCVPFLDRPDPHVTGQFISYSGGWSG